MIVRKVLRARSRLPGSAGREVLIRERAAALWDRIYDFDLGLIGPPTPTEILGSELEQIGGPAVSTGSSRSGRDNLLT
jgi:hypothetical protein